MKIGIYKSVKCKNQILKKPIDNKLDVEIEEDCAWCCEAHRFSLSEVVEE